MTQAPLSDRARTAFLDALMHDDPVGLYESAPCGFVTTTPDGLIVKANATFRSQSGYSATDLVGALSFTELLTVGSRIYFETHVRPTLLMSDRVREVAIDLLRADGHSLSVLINASLARSDDGQPRALRFAVFDATERRSYERELLAAKERAEQSEKQARELTRALQQMLIPPAPPEISGLEVAVAYHPAGHGTEVGGDFYDVFSVGPEEWVIILGDVCGKGYEAAVVAYLVTHTVRALCVSQERPSLVLAGLNDLLQQHPSDRFCTAVLLRLRRIGDDWSVSLSLGGHPQPVLLRATTPPKRVGTHGSLLGVMNQPTLVDTTFRIGVGDVIVLYTDGVTDGRHGTATFGEQALLTTLNRTARHPAQIVDAVTTEITAFQSGTLRDDVALVAFGPPAE